MAGNPAISQFYPVISHPASPFCFMPHIPILFIRPHGRTGYVHNGAIPLFFLLLRPQQSAYQPLFNPHKPHTKAVDATINRIPFARLRRALSAANVSRLQCAYFLRLSRPHLVDANANRIPHICGVSLQNLHTQPARNAYPSCNYRILYLQETHTIFGTRMCRIPARSAYR